MKNDQRRHYLTRSGLLEEGDEYVDLGHLEHGVRRAEGRPRIPMGRVLPRKAVRDATWIKIVEQLAALERALLN
jgi:hypothetical protein